MARGKSYAEKDGKNTVRKSGPVVESFDAEFRGFINLNLTEEQKKEFALWMAYIDFSELLRRHCSDGIVLSIKVDVKSGGYLASGTQRRVLSPNAGLAVTARASEPTMALWRLLFLLEVLPAEGWERMQPMADPDRW